MRRLTIKKAARNSTPSFSRQGTGSAPDWMKEFAAKAKDLAKGEQATPRRTAVEVMRSRMAPSVYEQLNAVINPSKSKFSTVQEVVSDYCDKAGLNAYHRHLKLEKAAAMLKNADEDFQADDDKKKSLQDLKF